MFMVAWFSVSGSLCSVGYLNIMMSAMQKVFYFSGSLKCGLPETGIAGFQVACFLILALPCVRRKLSSISWRISASSACSNSMLSQCSLLMW